MVRVLGVLGFSDRNRAWRGKRGGYSVVATN